MRKRFVGQQLSVHAVAGTNVVLLGLDVREDARDGFMGFAVARLDERGRPAWLRGYKTFRSQNPRPRKDETFSTLDAPIQKFLWSDYTVAPASTYRFRIVPLYGAPGQLDRGDSLDVEVRTEDPGAGAHAIHFNRGAAASQAYARQFGNKPPDAFPDRRAYEWLSRGLEERLLAFIGQARNRRYALRAAVYEFGYEPALRALAEADGRGADVKIVCDFKEGDEKPARRNDEAIRAADIGHLVTRRKKNPSYIAHNKFIVLLRDGKPIAVWTGSTNITEGAIFGHSNVGHVVRDEDVAKDFLDYWEQLASDPDAKSLRAWVEKENPLRARPRDGVQAVFSPRGSLQALQHYADLMDRARSAVFVTAAFGVNPLLRAVLAKDKPYLRYLLLEREDKPSARSPDVLTYEQDPENLRAIGSHLTETVLERWVQRNFGAEELTGLNKHVKYVHTKYMLVDPLSDDPLVITGSANFSDASTKNNDENMLVIRGDRRVADVYLGEFMRLFSHYRFRAFAGRRRRGRAPWLFLRETPAWSRPYFDPDSVKGKERLLFR